MTKKKQQNKSPSNQTDDEMPIKQTTNTPLVEEDQPATKKIEETKTPLENLHQENHLNNEHLQSILATKPLEKHVSVQFYPVDHVQFIANRFGKK